jgi:hypothetical protein
MKVAEINQFGSAQPVGSGPGPGCAHCEAMLADASDGTLSAADQAIFDRHIATCDVCSEMFADAQRGAALLSMLKPHRPEPSAALLVRIFAQTSVAQTSGATASVPEGHAALPHLVLAPAPVPVMGIGNVIPFPAHPARRFNLRAIGQTMLQPRLAMTAAMAFFSIALTLNLTGVHLNELRASDLKPANIERNLSDANARAVRYYENLRVVYELESRVRDLQHANDNDSPSTPSAPSSSPDGGSQPQQQKPKQDRPKPNSGTSQRQPLRLPQIQLAAAPVCETSDRPLPASIVCSNRLNQSNQFKEHIVEGGLV